ncbi:hypothetical protein EFA69_07570 [Rufibacter immobilis]|uniref:Colicin import membrane protein n=1 Tax=Rufibacter immobilis TaxID=1348778 RepID=A0A3M9MV45_9BACT|nr:hypothetical protein [Rufibacter immobilis]RNI29412.1 hypothetical protein EFA69_07570 [Rufibacter immobilis]
MKKSLIAVFALLVAAPAFAQSTTVATNPENSAKTTHGTTVSASAQAETTADGKGEVVREAARTKPERRTGQHAPTEEAKARRQARKEAAAQEREALKQKTKEDLKTNHGTQVSDLSRETAAAGRDKGQLVKETASAKRQTRAGRVETGAAAKVRVAKENRAKAHPKAPRPVKVNPNAAAKALRK